MAFYENTDNTHSQASHTQTERPRPCHMVMTVFEQIKTFTPVKLFRSVSMKLNPWALWKETRISVMLLVIFKRTRGRGVMG